MNYESIFLMLGSISAIFGLIDDCKNADHYHRFGTYGVSPFWTLACGLISFSILIR